MDRARASVAFVRARWPVRARVVAWWMMLRVLAGAAAILLGACMPNDAGSSAPTVQGIAAPAGDFDIDLFAPSSPAVAAVVFLPGFLAPARQYESYARGLADAGIAVAIRERYGPLRSDRELASDASAIADWLAQSGLVHGDRFGIAGHSTGGKDAIWAAALDRRFAAVVALDPDDQGDESVVHGVLADVAAPLLLVGAELGWKGADICAPAAHNYERFFERAPAGTQLLALPGADHVQLMDDPDALGMGMCRVGTADSAQVLSAANDATIAFFRRHLLGDASAVVGVVERERPRVGSERAHDRQ